MACPQTENGFTMIANELYDALNSYNFPSASPLKLVHIVIRKTYGFKKKEDYISLTQFEKSSKLSRPTVVYWLDALVKSLLLVKGVKLSKNGYTYGINKDFECWKPLVNSLKLVKPRQFTSKPPLTATSKPPLTHKRKKETITKESYNLEKAINYWNTLEIENAGVAIKTFGSLQRCRRETEDIKSAWNKVKPNKEDWELATQNYLAEINERDPKNDYAKHRFSFYEFIKQSNGFKKFLNKGGYDK